MEVDDPFASALSQLTVKTSRRDPRSLRLAAVTSALLDVVDSVTPPQIYAKAVTALEGTLNNDITPDTIATQVSLLELLCVTLPYIENKTIVTSTLPLTARVLRAMVATSREAAVLETKDELGGVNSLMRWTCRVVSKVLQSIQSNADAAQVKQFTNETLLSLLNDRRPKVRKEAAAGISEVLFSETCHKEVRKATSHYAHLVLTKARKAIQDQDRLGDTIHCLSFLETCIFKLDYNKLLQDIMELFSLLVQLDSSHTTSDFAAVTKVKENTPKILALTTALATVTALLKDTDPSRKRQLDELSPRVLASLLQAKPSFVFRYGAADLDLLQRGEIVWGECIVASFARVAQSDTEVALRLAPLTFQAIVLLSKPKDQDYENGSVAQIVMAELSQALRECLPVLLQSVTHENKKLLEESLSALSHVMDPLYRPNWSASLPTMVLFIQLVRSQVNAMQHAKSLIALRNQVPAGSPSQQAIEGAVIALVQGVGIELFWQWIEWRPLTNEGKISSDQAWLFSAMKTGMATAQPAAPRLCFFQNEILVAARECDKLGATTKSNHAFHQARVVDLWALFPFFCSGPSDVEASLPTLTMTVQRVIEDTRYPQLLSIICLGLKNLAMSVDRYSPQGEVQNETTRLLNQTSATLLPVLFKVVMATPENGSIAGPDMTDMDVDSNEKKPLPKIDSSQDPHLLHAIAALAKSSTDEYIQSLFKKLMQKLLEEIQSDPCNSYKICSYLSLCQALVASTALKANDILLMYRALKSLLRTDEHNARVQKRAYKVLYEICEGYNCIAANTEILNELALLLTDTNTVSNLAARHVRLKCMEIVLRGMESVNVEQANAFFQAAPEVMLCFKDTNVKTRSAAQELLSLMAEKCGTMDVLKVVAAGLGAQTSHMQSAAVLALSRLVYEFSSHSIEVQASLPSLLTTVLVLIDSNAREVVKSVVGFIRVSVTTISPEQLELVIPEVVGCLTRYHKPKNRFRSKIKIILKKLVKLFGYETLMPHIPESESRLLIHIKKANQRQEQKKAASRTPRSCNATAFDAMMGSDEEDSDEGRTLVSGTTRRTTAMQSTGKSKLTRSDRGTVTSGLGSARNAPTLRLPNDTSGEVVDMMSTKHTRLVQFAEDRAMDDSSDRDDMLEFDDDGRLIIKDDEPTHIDGVVDDMPPRHKQRTLKGTLSDERSRTGSIKSTKLGSNYKAKKAGGDVKRKDQKLEPYAFIPLDGRQYSRKNRRAAVNDMSHVVRGRKRVKR